MTAHLLAAWFTSITSAGWWAQFLHPGQLRNRGGYWFWSGIGSDLGEITLITAALVLIRGHNCTVKGCWRLRFHTHPLHGLPVCRIHMTTDHEHPLTNERVTTHTDPKGAPLC